MDTQISLPSQESPGFLLKPGWAFCLKDEFTKPYMDKIRHFLKEELGQGHRVFPPLKSLFRALQLVDYQEVRVVILGQDPYHGTGQANGLAFAVNAGVPAPPSLQNIFKEVSRDLSPSKTTSPNTTLENWAEQGVLLLNTVLSVRENTPLSHKNQGWEIFTNKVIQCLNGRADPIVFLLWGAAAQAKSILITNPKYKILLAPHPSPLSAHRGFFGCGHFSKTNAFLKEQGFQEIHFL